MYLRIRSSLGLCLSLILRVIPLNWKKPLLRQIIVRVTTSSLLSISSIVYNNCTTYISGGLEQFDAWRNVLLVDADLDGPYIIVHLVRVDKSHPHLHDVLLHHLLVNCLCSEQQMLES